jgi:hypothetical protein
MRNEQAERVAMALADGDAIDWRSAESGATTDEARAIIRRLARIADVGGDVAVLDGVHHHQVDFGAENPSEIVEKFEIGVDPGVGLHRAEFDQEVDIAFAKAKVRAGWETLGNGGRYDDT